VSDFIVFTGSVASGSVEYQALSVPGFTFGAEIGGELGAVFVLAGVEETLAYFSTPYRTSMDLQVGYGFAVNLYGVAGFSSLARSIPEAGNTTGNELGELSDGQSLFTLGVGYSL
jgi:hypothetical protein